MDYRILLERPPTKKGGQEHLKKAAPRPRRQIGLFRFVMTHNKANDPRISFKLLICKNLKIADRNLPAISLNDQVKLEFTRRLKQLLANFDGPQRIGLND